MASRLVRYDSGWDGDGGYYSTRQQWQATSAYDSDFEEESRPILSWPYLPAVDRRPREDKNRINQQNKHYLSLRARANEHGDAMARCYQESREAYGRGEGARAKELSDQGKQHGRAMENFNTEASAWIFRENNSDNGPGEIDLHGLYVKEAVLYASSGIQQSRQRGNTEIRFIVGRGSHSDGNFARVKRAIEDLTRSQGIPTEVDPLNAGVLIARLR